MQKEIQQQKLNRLKQERLEAEMEQCSFKPAIDEASQMLAKGNNKRRQDMIEQISQEMFHNNGQFGNGVAEVQQSPNFQGYPETQITSMLGTNHQVSNPHINNLQINTQQQQAQIQQYFNTANINTGPGKFGNQQHSLANISQNLNLGPLLDNMNANQKQNRSQTPQLSSLGNTYG